MSTDNYCMTKQEILKALLEGIKKKPDPPPEIDPEVKQFFEDSRSEPPD
jgi:hypothetical protein